MLNIVHCTGQSHARLLQPQMSVVRGEKPRSNSQTVFLVQGMPSQGALRMRLVPVLVIRIQGPGPFPSCFSKGLILPYRGRLLDIKGLSLGPSGKVCVLNWNGITSSG